MLGLGRWLEWISFRNKDNFIVMLILSSLRFSTEAHAFGGYIESDWEANSMYLIWTLGWPPWEWERSRV